MESSLDVLSQAASFVESQEERGEKSSAELTIVNENRMSRHQCQFSKDNSSKTPEEVVDVMSTNRPSSNQNGSKTPSTITTPTVNQSHHFFQQPLSSAHQQILRFRPDLATNPSVSSSPAAANPPDYNFAHYSFNSPVAAAAVANYAHAMASANGSLYPYFTPVYCPPFLPNEALHLEMQQIIERQRQQQAKHVTTSSSPSTGFQIPPVATYPLLYQLPHPSAHPRPGLLAQNIPNLQDIQQAAAAMVFNQQMSSYGLHHPLGVHPASSEANDKSKMMQAPFLLPPHSNMYLGNTITPTSSSSDPNAADKDSNRIPEVPHQPSYDVMSKYREKSPLERREQPVDLHKRQLAPHTIHQDNYSSSNGAQKIQRPTALTPTTTNYAMKEENTSSPVVINGTQKSWRNGQKYQRASPSIHRESAVMTSPAPPSNRSSRSLPSSPTSGNQKRNLSTERPSPPPHPPPPYEHHITHKPKAFSNNGHMTSEPRHVTSEPRHVTSEPRHVTSEPRHVTSEPRHVTSEPRHVTAEPRHVTSESRHSAPQPAAFHPTTRKSPKPERRPKTPPQRPQIPYLMPSNSFGPLPNFAPSMGPNTILPNPLQHSVNRNLNPTEQAALIAAMMNNPHLRFQDPASFYVQNLFRTQLKEPQTMKNIATSPNVPLRKPQSPPKPFTSHESAKSESSMLKPHHHNNDATRIINSFTSQPPRVNYRMSHKSDENAMKRKLPPATAPYSHFMSSLSSDHFQSNYMKKPKKHSADSADVDEHFRRSLGPDYASEHLKSRPHHLPLRHDVSNATSSNGVVTMTSSHSGASDAVADVEAHFTKSLGPFWKNLKETDPGAPKTPNSPPQGQFADDVIARSLLDL